MTTTKKNGFVVYACCLVAGTLLGASAWMGLFYAQLGAPTGTSRWIHNSIEVKVAAIRKIQEPKLLAVGGSSVMYGVRTKRIQKALGIPAVNMGINAGLQLRHMLYEAKKWLQKGDTVLLLLEYPVYNYDGLPNDVYADFVVSRDPEGFADLPLGWKARIIFYLSFDRLLSGLKSRYIAEPIHIPGHLVGSDLNENGDQLVGNLEKDRKLEALQELELADVSQETWISMDTLAWPLIADFIGGCRAKKVRVIAGYPPVFKFKGHAHPNFQDNLALVESFYTEQGVPVLGKPMDFMVPKDWLYDSAYHLHQGRMDDHTDNLVRHLKPLFK